jgi:hypothetical protein
MAYSHRLRIERNYDGIQLQYDTRISALPINEAALFSDSISSKTGIHNHERLLALLTTGLGSRKRALEALKDAMRGRSVEVFLIPGVPIQLLLQFANSSGIA